MTRDQYFKTAFELYNSSQVTAEVYDAMISNADIFCDDDYSDNLPDTYAEISYSDFDNSEAIDGARWDDVNYLHYTER